MGRWENGRPGNEGWPVAGGTASEGWRTLFDGGKAGAGADGGALEDDAEADRSRSAW